MIDLLQVFCRSQEAHDAILRERQDSLEFSGSTSTGAVDNYNGYDNHIFIKTFESNPPGVRLRGSLHKYAHGINSDTFTISEIKNATSCLMSKYHLDGSEPIQRIEIGINLPFKYPEAVIDSSMMYHGKIGERSYKKDYYANVWSFLPKQEVKDKLAGKIIVKDRVNYLVKLYVKGEGKIRYELHIENMQKMRGTGIRVISDLLDDNKLILALAFLYKSIDELFFVPDDPKKKLPQPLSLKWGSYRADSLWQSLGTRERKDEKYKLKTKITEYIDRYDLIDWRAVMKRRFLLEAAKIAEVTTEVLVATFLRLGLEVKTVAGPKGNRDRQTDNVNEMNIPVRVHPAVANVWWTTDVIIYAPSYFPLSPRGPPSPCGGGEPFSLH